MEEQYYKDDKTIHCEKCGGDYVEGDFPFCKGRVEDHDQMHGFDDAFEPYVDIQLLDKKDPRCNAVGPRGNRGVMINSRSERREWMKKLGLQYGSQKWEKRGKKDHMFFDMGKR